VPDYVDTVTALVRNRLAISTIRRVDVEVVLGQWGSRWIDCWRDLPTNPRVASSEQVCHATYDAWMSQCISQPAPYVDYDQYIHPEHLADLMRIRLGCHSLNVTTGRWVDGGVPRAHRYCKKCRQYSVEDEKHFMMECPAYQDIRSEDQDI
jgi:hypothetical protein